jgi:hypothetical protein
MFLFVKFCGMCLTDRLKPKIKFSTVYISYFFFNVLKIIKQVLKTVFCDDLIKSSTKENTKFDINKFW